MRGPRKIISAHYSVIDTHSFPSLSNKDITETLDAMNNPRDVPFPKDLYEKNSKGEMVDPWGRPIVFVREGDRVIAKPPGPPLESKWTIFGLLHSTSTPPSWPK